MSSVEAEREAGNRAPQAPPAARRLLRIARRSALALALAAAAAWSALALLLAPILPDPFRWPAALAVVAVAAASLGAPRRLHARVAAALLAVLTLLTMASWAALRPAADAAWIAEVAQQPVATVAGDRATIRNVRNFAWRSESDFDARWEERSYDLRQLERVDLLASYWAGESIAHIMVSFGFADGEQLAASIEIRRREGQDYSPVAGFFRNYELVYVLADERDLVRLRTNVRGERVFLYRLRAAPEAARRLFLEYVREINALAAEPRFYNTLLTNCTTQLRLAATAAGARLPWDWRLVLTGHTPEYLYDHGSVDVRLPFDLLRQRADITQAALSAGAEPLFSRRIRDGRPDPLL